MNRLATCFVVLLAFQPPVRAEEPTYKGRPVREWVDRLTDPDLRVRSQAVREFGPEAIGCVPAIIESLRFESMEFRENSCNPERRRSIAAAFRKIGPDAVPALTQALNDPQPSIRGWSAFFLADLRHDPHTTVAKLTKLLEDPDPGVRRLATKGLSNLGNEAWMTTGLIISLLRDDDAGVRVQAISALRCRPGDLLPTLAPAIADSNAEVRFQAVLFLRRFGGPAVPHLIQALSDADPRVRRTAAYEIKALGSVARDATERLIEILRADADRDVRYAAATAIGAIGPPAKDAVPALIDGLNSGDSFVASAAVRAVGQIGPEARDAIPALRALLNVEAAPNPSIRRLLRTEIANALRSVESNSERRNAEEAKPSIPRGGDDGPR